MKARKRGIVLVGTAVATVGVAAAAVWLSARGDAPAVASAPAPAPRAAVRTTATGPATVQDAVRRVARLRGLELTDSGGFGGPWVGVRENDVTTAIVACGPAAVGPLVDALADSDWTEAVYVVWCLRQLEAKSATPAVLALREQVKSGRFRAERQDATLHAQIAFFLRDAPGW